MKVLKFGGTSVGSVQSINNVKKIVESLDEQAIVVVSALGGITDMLISTAKMASVGDSAYLQNYAQIIERHNTVINGVVPKEKQLDVMSLTNPLLEELGNIYRGVALIKDLSQRTLDIIVSYGERLSSVIISKVITGAIHYDSRNFVKTELQYGKHVADLDLTNELVCSTFSNFTGKVAVVPGFISTDKDTGNISNLGRGGSDYTAAIIAAALNASVLQIWTDVDGFMTADPRVISNAYVIDHLSFVEAMELCHFGAKVIYPPTIYPVFHKNIPIVIKNTFNPDAPGSWITDERPAKDSKAIRTDIYTETEITVEEAVLTVLEAIDQRMIGRRFAFTEQISIGRSDDNDIVINDGYVSHHHAVITLYNNLYVIEDLGSRNRTLVNGQELEGRQYLQSGDMISVGTVVLQFGR